MTNFYSIKFQATVRYIMVHSISERLPLFIVNEYPKSGGTWVGQMLSHALDIPFPRNCFPGFQPCIMHGHFKSSFGMKNVTIVWRDGRDMMVSWYHHCLFKYKAGNSSLVNKVTRALSIEDPNNVIKNLPRFLEYSFSGKLYPRYSWPVFVRQWYGRPDTVYVRYEDLRLNTVAELQRVVKELSGKTISTAHASEIVEEFSFIRQTGRNPGEESKENFLRKGLVGDWRNYFCPESCEIFEHYAGDILIQLGYEKDNSWTQLTHPVSLD